MGLRYKGTFGNHLGESFTVEIDKQGYGGIVDTMEFAENGVQLFYSERSVFDPIFSSGVEIQVWQYKEDQYADLFLTSDRVNKLSLYKKTGASSRELLWQGWIITDIFEYDLSPCPRAITIPAACGLSDLSDYRPTFDAKQHFTAIKTVFSQCLIGTQFPDDFIINCSLQANGIAGRSLADCIVMTETLYQEQDGGLLPRNALEIITDILTSFGWRLSHQRGIFRIDRMPNLINPATVYHYNYQGVKTIVSSGVKTRTVGNLDKAWTDVPRVSMDAGYGSMNVSVKNLIRNSFDGEVGVLNSPNVPYYKDTIERKAYYDAIDGDGYYTDHHIVTYYMATGQEWRTSTYLVVKEYKDSIDRRVFKINYQETNPPMGLIASTPRAGIGLFKRAQFSLRGAEKIVVSFDVYIETKKEDKNFFNYYWPRGYFVPSELIINDSINNKLHFNGTELKNVKEEAQDRTMPNTRIANYRQWQTISYSIDIKDKDLADFRKFVLIIYPPFTYSNPDQTGMQMVHQQVTLHIRNISVKADSSNYNNGFIAELAGSNYKRKLDPLEFIYNTDVGDVNLLNTIYVDESTVLKNVSDNGLPGVTIMDQLINDRMTLHGEPRPNISMTTEDSVVLPDEVLQVAGETQFYSIKSIRSRLHEGESDLTIESIKPNDVTIIYE